MMMKVYLVRLGGAARRPHELHDGHEDGDDEAADQHHEDAADVLHAETCNTHTHAHTHTHTHTHTPSMRWRKLLGDDRAADRYSDGTHTL